MKKIESLKKKIVPILKKHGVVRAGIFGSYARGEQKKNSDVDVVIKYPKGLGFGFVGIKIELEDKLKTENKELKKLVCLDHNDSDICKELIE